MRKKITVLITIFSLIFFVHVKADNPPDPGGGPTGDPVGGGSPVGSGLLISMILGLAYTSKKVYQMKVEE